MSDALDEGLVQRIDARGTIQWSGTCARYTGARRDPLSGGEGGHADSAAGGTRRCCSQRSIWPIPRKRAWLKWNAPRRRHQRPPEKLLEASYRLHTIEATDLSVLDLTTPEAREAVGLEDDDIHGDDWSACQAVGHAAWFLHVQGVLVPAAGGVGLVITAYEQRTRPGQLQVTRSEHLTPARYRELRQL